MQKYKLINKQTGESHLCDKVIIDGFDYYVSDEKIKVSDWVINNLDKGVGQTIREISIDEIEDKEYSKVIATNNPNIDIPKVIDEIENLCKSNVEKIYSKYIPKDLLDDYITLYKLGYNKSQETHPFSEEDMIEFGIWLHDTAFATYQVGGEYIGMWHIHYPDFTYVTSKELLQFWKEQKPKTIYYE